MTRPAAIPRDGSPPEPAGYEADYHQWLLDNAALLRAGRLDAIDAANLAEELEDMGRGEARALQSHLRVLMTHLLKWQYQPGARSSGWRGSIANARFEIDDLLADSPSLRGRLPAQVAAQYPRARLNAANETGLAESSLLADCPWSAEQLLDTGFWPN